MAFLLLLLKEGMFSIVMHCHAAKEWEVDSYVCQCLSFLIFYVTLLAPTGALVVMMV